MLIRTTDINNIREAQDQMATELSFQLKSLGKKWVTFRPTSVELPIWGRRGGLYFGTRTIRKESKFWNAFGIFDHERGKQEITVEINFSVNGGRTAGFFADSSDGHRYLMHTGGIGGGKVGVSRDAFMAWLKPELVAVQANGKVDAGILIAELGSPDLAQRIESFVMAVRSFKDAVNDGLLDRPEFSSSVATWRDYRREFSGRKAGTVEVDLDYTSYHGDVVHALKAWVEGKDEKRSVVTNSPLIDLLVHIDGALSKVYEVKTSVSRQALYTGIGQLIVHTSGEDAGRTLVLPAKENLPNDIEAGLHEAGIEVLRYKLFRDGKVSILG